MYWNILKNNKNVIYDTVEKVDVLAGHSFALAKSKIAADREGVQQL